MAIKIPRQTTPAKRVTFNRPAIVPTYSGSRQSRACASETYLPLGTAAIRKCPVGFQAVLQGVAQAFMRTRRVLLETHNFVPGGGPVACFVQSINIGTYLCSVGVGLASVGMFSPQSVANPILGGVPLSAGLIFSVVLINGDPAGEYEVQGTVFGDGT